MMTMRLEAAAFRAAMESLLLQLKNPRQFFKVWGVDVVNMARNNARAKGGRHFWASIARAVRLAGVTNVSALIVCDHVAGAQKEYGGVIRAKNVAHLTIPIAEEAEGKRASEFEARGLFVIRAADGSRAVLGYSEGEGDDARFVGLYVLVTQTRKQDPDPWWPAANAVAESGLRRANQLLRLQE